MITRSDRGANWGTSRMETELASWLRTFEPDGAPTALRLRTFADLQTEADSPRRRLAWLRPALSSTAPLGAVLLWAVLILLVAVPGTIESSGAGAPGRLLAPGFGGPSGPSSSTAPAFAWDPVWIVALLMASALVGLGVTLRPVRASVRRLVLGKEEAIPEAPLPLPRSWRTVPRLALALGVLPVIGILWSSLLYTPTSPSYEAGLVLTYLLGAVGCVVALRYPRGDRSTNVLLVGGVALAVMNLPGLALMTSGQLGLLNGSDWLGPTLSYMNLFVSQALTATGWLALAFGLAGRSGVARRPPAILAAAAACGSLLVTIARFAQISGEQVAVTGPPDQFAWLDPVVRAATSWLLVMAWMAILWTGLGTGWRRGAPVGWQLVLMSGAMATGAFWFFSATGLLGLSVPDWLGSSVLWGLAGLGPVFALALLIGLRPMTNEASSPVTSARERRSRSSIAS